MEAPILIQRNTWYRSQNGKRIFLITGHWYAGDPEKEEIEILELYSTNPLRHNRKEVEDLIRNGEMIRI